MKKYICDKCSKYLSKQEHCVITIKYPVDDFLHPYNDIILDLCEECLNGLLYCLNYKGELGG